MGFTKASLDGLSKLPYLQVGIFCFIILAKLDMVVDSQCWKAERPINPILILTGNELLNYPGPLYCWDDPIRKKFGNIRGVLGLCNATQQIYLKLLPWVAEWREKWNKKRQPPTESEAAKI